MHENIEKVRASGLASVLKDTANKLARSSSTRPGSIVVRETAPEGRHYHIECTPEAARFVEGEAKQAPIIELIGDLSRIQGILSGTKDARAQFLAGGFRIRGDLRYASDIALELGIIKDPL